MVVGASGRDRVVPLVTSWNREKTRRGWGQDVASKGSLSSAGSYFISAQYLPTICSDFGSVCGFIHL